MLTVLWISCTYYTRMAQLAGCIQRTHKALVVTAPVDLRDQLRGRTTKAQIATCAAFASRQRTPGRTRRHQTSTPQPRRRINALTAEEVQQK